ncbi:zinc finger protein-like [Tropilaelaps mercedesae]|uniref:Zinc finger protein-like n=1 Tax=Tropilaelaps mercedesae TaxID=418985 RepID=A0A1V9XRD9_9ACAR|nr:zinc finger protein-like [Tropilaelaps mercedesae]
MLKAHEGPLNGHHCGVCDLPQRDYRHLVFHMVTHQNKGSSTLVEETPSAGDHAPEEGEDAFNNTADSTKTASFMCRECNRSFEAESQLIAHQVWVHQGCENNSNPCPVCGKLFTRQQYLALHLRRHVDERPYRCEHCGRTFPHLATLKGHVTRKHTRDFRFQCPICDKGFISRMKTLHHLEQAHHYSSVAARAAMDEGKQQITMKLKVMRLKMQEDETQFPPGVTGIGFHKEESTEDKSGQSEAVAKTDPPGCFDVRNETGRQNNVSDQQVSPPSTSEHSDKRLDEAQGIVRSTPAANPLRTAVTSGNCPELRRDEIDTLTSVELAAEVDDADVDEMSGEVLYQLHHPDGSQSLVRLQPGQSLVLEDENGVKQVIDYSDVVASAAGDAVQEISVGGQHDETNESVSESVHVQSDSGYYHSVTEQ